MSETSTDGTSPTSQPEATAPRRRRTRVLAIVEWTLIGVGLACVAAYGIACAGRSYYQTVEEVSFGAEIQRGLALERHHDQSDWSKKRVGAFEASLSRDVEARARLEIPTAGLSVMVLEGDDDVTLDRAVGRIPGTADFDQDGNVGIAGHRDGFFRGLRHVAVGDELTLSTLNGVSQYEITELRIVSPEDVEVLDPTPTKRTLTLVTCHPFYYVGSAPRRFIVRAEQVSFAPWTSETVAAFLDASVASR